MTLTIGADDARAMVAALERIAAELGAGGLRGPFANGSPDVGFHGETIENPGMSHDRYIAELEGYLRRETAE